MIRVSVLYPASSTPFNYDYYLNQHTPLVESSWKPLGLTGVEISKGVSGLAPGSGPKYATVTVLTFASMEALQACLSAAAAVIGDIPNFTDVQPDIQINQPLT